MAEAWGINEAAGAPAYAAQELRRIAAMYLCPGVTHRFGARQGVRPHSTPVVTVAGTTWIQHDLSAVVYPGLTSISGPYVVEKIQESDSLNPADGTNDRIDGLDLRIRDDDEDGLTLRDVTVVYVPGTPAGSPVAPAVTANSLRLATILVPSGGSPSPTVQTLAPFTVALGGILPVGTAGDLPAAGRYEGMYADQADDDALYRWNGSAWVPVASASSFNSYRRVATTIRTTNTATFTAETVINTVAASLVTGRRYRIRWLPDVTTNATGTIVRFRLREDSIAGTVLQLVNEEPPTTNRDYPTVLEAEFTAVSTASKTFAATAAREVGAGVLTCAANANEPQYLYVDQIGT